MYLTLAAAPQLVALGFLQRMGRTTPDITHLLLTFQPSLEENYGLDFLYGVFLSYIRELVRKYILKLLFIAYE